jgi:D-apiose dehydrogenase
MQQYNIARHYSDYREMLEKEKPDFVDIITPPETHYEMTKFAADRGIDVICQKPLAPAFSEAQKIVAYQKSRHPVYGARKLALSAMAPRN